MAQRKIETKDEAYILYRDLFDQWLAGRAMAAGVETRLNTKITGLTEEGAKTKDNEIKGKIIVGADGPVSRIGKLAGIDIKGAGIANALRCGKIAGECIVHNGVKKYEGLWKEELGRGLKRNYKLKQVLDKWTNKYQDRISILLADIYPIVLPKQTFS